MQEYVHDFQFTVIRLYPKDARAQGFYNSSSTSEYCEGIWAATKWKREADKVEIFNVYSKLIGSNRYKNVEIATFAGEYNLEEKDDSFYNERIVRLALAKLTTKEVELLGASHLLAQTILED